MHDTNNLKHIDQHCALTPEPLVGFLPFVAQQL